MGKKLGTAISTLAMSTVMALAMLGCSPGEPTAQPSPSESETPTGPTDPADLSPSATNTPDAAQRALEMAQSLSIDEQAGLLVMAGVPATGASKEEIAALAENGFSNVFLRGRSQLSITQTRAEVDAITEKLAENLPQELPTWIATDQEGGFVRVLQGPGFSELPTALAQGSWSQHRLRETLQEVGNELSEAGINVNLAPVADTVPESLAEQNIPIGYWKRNFGYNPVSVSMAVLQANEAFHDAGVQPVVKHFPGLGRVTQNTDTDSNVTDDASTAEDEYLKPFTDSIAQDLSWVMISNARYTQLDQQNMAPFSEKIITGLLREQLGYERLIISDDLCEAKQVESIPVGQRAVDFVRAGGTMPLCVDLAKSVTMVQALGEQAASDAGFAQQLQKAAALVLDEKLRNLD